MHEKYISRFNERHHTVEGGCWEWTGTSRGKTGYGCLKIEGKIIDVHRFSFIIHKGSIPDGMLICHSCDNRRCVNPEHLFLGTHKDNHQDAVNKGRINPMANNKLAIHPSLSAYQKRKCRCAECRKIYADHRKKWKDKQVAQAIVKFKHNLKSDLIAMRISNPISDIGMSHNSTIDRIIKDYL